MDRTPAQRFEDLISWQKTYALALRVYKLTADVPKHEMIGLSSQMRRAAVSVPANIAGGFCKRGRSDKARFLNTAQGSLEELWYYFILARDLACVPKSVSFGEIDDVARMLGAYTATLRTPSS
jgi:four helix bundle protein